MNWDQVRLFFSVTTRDVTLEASVTSTKDYGAESVLYGMRYVDAVSRDQAGRTLADIERRSAYWNGR